jgi:hypothetical protein
MTNYPRRWYNAMKRVFVEMSEFTALMQAEGTNDKELSRLQMDIMSGLGKTIAGSGGVKKIRWRMAGRGKSGGSRVLFADYEEFGVTLLLTAFPKNVKANVTGAEVQQLRRLKAVLDEYVRSKHEHQD